MKKILILILLLVSSVQAHEPNKNQKKTWTYGRGWTNNQCTWKRGRGWYQCPKKKIVIKQKKKSHLKRTKHSKTFRAKVRSLDSVGYTSSQPHALSKPTIAHNKVTFQPKTTTKKKKKNGKK